jgi:hypothetical protein
MVRAARGLLSSVTRVLLLADIVVVKQLLILFFFFVSLTFMSALLLFTGNKDTQ